jgi:hypothetical protein
VRAIGGQDRQSSALHGNVDGAGDKKIVLIEHLPLGAVHERQAA